MNTLQAYLESDELIVLSIIKERGTIPHTFIGHNDEVSFAMSMLYNTRAAQLNFFHIVGMNFLVHNVGQFVSVNEIIYSNDEPEANGKEGILFLAISDTEMITHIYDIIRDENGNIADVKLAVNDMRPLTEDLKMNLPPEGLLLPPEEIRNDPEAIASAKNWLQRMGVMIEPKRSIQPIRKKNLDDAEIEKKLKSPFFVPGSRTLN